MRIQSVCYKINEEFYKIGKENSGGFAEEVVGKSGFIRASRKN